MKAISKLLLCATLLGVFSTSCSDESDNSPVAPAGKIIATVGGTSWEATGIAVMDDDYIMVGGESGGKSINVEVVTGNVVGTYEVKGMGALAPKEIPDAIVEYGTSGVYTTASLYCDNDVAVGSVVITEIDEAKKTVSGTFHSKLKNYVDGTTFEITTGSFTKIPYTKELTTSTMSAKIDGVQFNSSVVVSASAMGMLVLNGQTLGGQQIITISVPETITVGTYALGELGLSDQYTTYTKNGNTYASVSGTLKITAHNKTTQHIEGTFTFAAEPFGFEASNVSATEGAFSVDY